MGDSDVIMESHEHGIRDFSVQAGNLKVELIKVDLKCMETQTLMNGVRENGASEEDHHLKEVNANEVRFLICINQSQLSTIFVLHVMMCVEF